MNVKIIDFNRTIYELSKEYPEVIEIMKELGFTSIADPKMLNTAGRFMTITKGAAMKGIDIDFLREQFTSRGYQIK
ncbi:MAG: DUF1858 domain-containing protein [Eubacteriaceae bacterium]|nr:DUF1858 domain-containing protein [Eubacteriaceae bacterium]